jgi:DNA-binding CsgD family transcriptional regulator
MQPIKKAVLNHTTLQNSSGPRPVVAEVGLILLDLSLKIIGYDRAAAAILTHPNQQGAKPAAVSSLPKEILDLLRNRKPADLPPVKIYLGGGKDEYICRAHVVEFFDGSLKPVIALHLEKDFSAADAAYELGDKYNLTEREQEALRGILMGLSSKEVAGRMNISPNTVKAFLRLIMIKMGVTRRAGIVAKILENRSNAEDHESLSAAMQPGGMMDEPDNAHRAMVGADSPDRQAPRNPQKLIERVRPRPRPY